LIGAVLTLGLGSFGSVNKLPTLGYGAGAPAPPVVPSGGAHYTGGWVDLPTGRRTKEEIRESRERFGVIPKKAEVIIRRVVAKAIVEPEVNQDDLIAAFNREAVAYKALYAELWKQELDRQQEEEETILLLMLH